MDGAAVISEASRRRLVKRRVWAAAATFRLTCPPGLESALRDEVVATDAAQVKQVTAGAVVATGPFDAVYELMVRSRLADAVRVRVSEFQASTAAMAFDHLRRIPWPAWLPDRVDLEVRVTSRASALRDDLLVTRTLTSAVRRSGIDARAVRNGGGGDEPAPQSAPRIDLRVDLRRDRAEIWLTCHAQPLHLRVEGRWVTPGSLRETTAAAACRLGVPRDADLVVDPFCGSGTMIEEAIGWISGVAPGAHREHALAPSPALSEARLRHAVRTASAAVKEADRSPVAFVASDVDPRAVRTTRHNLDRLTLVDEVRLDVRPASAVDLRALCEQAAATTPVLLMHPPYGRRSQAVEDGERGPAGDRVWMRVVEAARGWRFVVVHPRGERLASLDGVDVTSVTHFRMRGLANAIVVGSVEGSLVDAVESSTAASEVR